MTRVVSIVALASIVLLNAAPIAHADPEGSGSYVLDGLKALEEQRRAAMTPAEREADDRNALLYQMSWLYRFSNLNTHPTFSGLATPTRDELKKGVSWADDLLARPNLDVYLADSGKFFKKTFEDALVALDAAEIKAATERRIKAGSKEAADRSSNDRDCTRSGGAR